MEKEIWKDVPNYEGYYQVSNLGSVRSIRSSKKLKPFLHRYGYKMVNFSVGGFRKTFTVHQLVAMAFLNHKPNGHNNLVVDHINNNCKDNSVGNLQLITTRENSSKDKVGYSSKYVGVNWCSSRKKWRASIKVSGKTKHIGYYKNEIEASNAYNERLNSLPINGK